MTTAVPAHGPGWGMHYHVFFLGYCDPSNWGHRWVWEVLSNYSSLISHCRRAQQVLLPWWWWGMWGVWANDQHQRLWSLYPQRLPGPVGFQRVSLSSQWPGVPRVGGHWSASGNSGKEDQSPLHLLQSQVQQCKTSIRRSTQLTCSLDKESFWC